MVKRVSLGIKNRKRFKYRIEHKTMPSKAIGMGVCPRCGKPGTIVIKAGNYVYIKHGNTWHYIGTIDKVNLNKILIKNPETVLNSPKYGKHKLNNRSVILLMSLVLAIGLILLGIFVIKMMNLNGKSINSTSLLNCNIVNSTNNGVYTIVCANVSNYEYKNITTYYFIANRYNYSFYNITAK